MGDIRNEMIERDRQCMAKAIQRHQLTFTIVEQDRSAAKSVAYWILENIETAPSHKLHEALEFCIYAREYEKKKNAD